MHWFSKKDTLHYFYTNGVEECDKNGGHRLNWVNNAGTWTKQTTPIDFVPYTKQAGTTSTNTGTRPTTNTQTQSNNGLTIRTGTLNGTPYKAYYRQDGTLERMAYYRADETLERTKLYNTDGTIKKIIHHGPPNTPNTCLLYTSPSPRD